MGVGTIEPKGFHVSSSKSEDIHCNLARRGKWLGGKNWRCHTIDFKVYVFEIKWSTLPNDGKIKDLTRYKQGG